MVISTVHPVSAAGSRDPLPEVSTVAIIPARYLSTRLPGKPLVDIAGRPMIEHVYRRAAAAPSIGAVVVATDDARVRAAVQGFGGLVRLTSATHRSGTDRLAEVAAELRCELVVNVQCDEPLVEPTMLEQALAPFGADPELMMTTLRCRIDDPTDLLDPNVVKVVTDRDGYALYFSRSPLPFSRGGAAHSASGVAYKHIGLYVYRRAFCSHVRASSRHLSSRPKHSSSYACSSTAFASRLWRPVTIPSGRHSRGPRAGAAHRRCHRPRVSAACRTTTADPSSTFSSQAAWSRPSGRG